MLPTYAYAELLCIPKIINCCDIKNEDRKWGQKFSAYGDTNEILSSENKSKKQFSTIHFPKLTPSSCGKANFVTYYMYVCSRLYLVKDTQKSSFKLMSLTSFERFQNCTPSKLNTCIQFMMEYLMKLDIFSSFNDAMH